MKKKDIFLVSFKYSESTYCSNIAIAESIEDVRAHYSKKYTEIFINGATLADIEEAKKKGKPVIEIEPQESDKERADRLEKTLNEAMRKYVDLLEKYTALEKKAGQLQAEVNFYDACMIAEPTDTNF